MSNADLATTAAQASMETSFATFTTTSTFTGSAANLVPSSPPPKAVDVPEKEAPQEEEVDYDPVQAVTGAEDAPHVKLSGQVSDSRHQCLGLDAAELVVDLYPPFIQPEQAQRETGMSQPMNQMQAKKARSFE